MQLSNILLVTDPFVQRKLYPEKYTNKTDKGRALRSKSECRWNEPGALPTGASSLRHTPVSSPCPHLPLESPWPGWPNLTFNKIRMSHSCSELLEFSRIPSSAQTTMVLLPLSFGLVHGKPCPSILLVPPFLGCWVPRKEQGISPG